jgi:hypothetical protein
VADNRPAPEETADDFKTATTRTIDRLTYLPVLVFSTVAILGAILGRVLGWVLPWGSAFADGLTAFSVFCATTLIYWWTVIAYESLHGLHSPYAEVVVIDRPSATDPLRNLAALVDLLGVLDPSAETYQRALSTEETWVRVHAQLEQAAKQYGIRVDLSRRRGRAW